LRILHRGAAPGDDTATNELATLLDRATLAESAR
jgi:hypothetical protein